MSTTEIKASEDSAKHYAKYLRFDPWAELKRKPIQPPTNEREMVEQQKYFRESISEFLGLVYERDFACGGGIAGIEVEPGSPVAHMIASVLLSDHPRAVYAVAASFQPDQTELDTDIECNNAASYALDDVLKSMQKVDHDQTSEDGKDLIYYVDEDRNMHCSYMTEEEFEAMHECFIQVGDPAVIWWPGESPVMPTKPTPLDEEIKKYAAKRNAE